MPPATRPVSICPQLGPFPTINDNNLFFHSITLWQVHKKPYRRSDSSSRVRTAREQRDSSTN